MRHLMTFSSLRCFEKQESNKLQFHQCRNVVETYFCMHIRICLRHSIHSVHKLHNIFFCYRIGTASLLSSIYPPDLCILFILLTCVSPEVGLGNNCPMRQLLPRPTLVPYPLVLFFFYIFFSGYAVVKQTQSCHSKHTKSLLEN